MKLKDTIIKASIKSAIKCNGHKQRHGAVIFKGSHNIISMGYNHPNRYCNKLNPEYRRWISSVHAEVDAILNANIKDCKRSSLLVVRINQKQEFRMSKPCIHCMNLIKYVGIKRVFYSINTYPFFEEIILY